MDQGDIISAVRETDQTNDFTDKCESVLSSRMKDLGSKTCYFVMYNALYTGYFSL